MPLAARSRLCGSGSRNADNSLGPRGRQGRAVVPHTSFDLPRIDFKGFHAGPSDSPVTHAFCFALVAAQRSSTSRNGSRRTKVVWLTFFSAVATVMGVLALIKQTNPRPGFLLTSVEVLGQTPQNDAVFQTRRPLDRQRWNSIVIHHSGEPAGDAQTITRQHLAAGLKGLGHHFLIGNGNGLGDGVVHVGYRWIDQLPGAHVSGPQQDEYNERSIAICLVGNGDRRRFTDRQVAQLVGLVQRLQAELNIPARNVYLHRDLSRATTSPGRFFPTAALQEQLLAE
jgi:hypothetical protein